MAEPRRCSCCLVVEDEFLVADSVEDCLAEAGYEVCGPLGSTREALAWLERNTPSAAIVDYGLKHGPSNEVVRELRARKVPVVIFSGSGREQALEFATVPWVLKSQGCAFLVKTLGTLVTPAGAPD